jgi:sarcosine oxidase
MTAGSVVLAADAWTNALLEPLGHALPLRVTQEQVVWHEPGDAVAFTPATFPIWIWLDEPSFYGFPTYRAGGPKIGQDLGGQPTTAESRTFEPDRAAVARVEAFLGAHLPAARGRRLRVKTCLYTVTLDRDFVVDRLPDHPGVVVGLGAAHGYKFAALFGRWLAGLALDHARLAPERLFAIDRAALRPPAAERGLSRESRST